ncbi:uncharacterized protein LAESUDRAFT_725152 [Laetiporus sulphureus 93-53]|uniref:Outer spore wall protein RRT8 n=1 Tax=Laetiporus sulphureus 93-53 TaxID=1314785 RepID=A0A165EKI3_9APHY|nr:uncharacterized protein LAESUDRAFT_725152 [Laetiporus sulphureus 93-53]KZT07247.1 hypothetical protein LAESUDRAFT_725152 [Laetiporus sulphureus 93-53]
MTSAEHSQLQHLARTLLREGQHVVVLTAQAIASLAWLWPLRGIYFSVTHPAVILSARGAILKALVSSAVVFGTMFFLTFFPQLAIVAFITGPLAPVIAFILVGAETAAILALLVRPLFLEPALTQVFDTTLRARGQGDLVRIGKTRAPGAGKSAASSVEGALVKPLQILSKDGLFKYLLTLPLNFVPAVGTALFLMYNGYNEGPGWHSHYFQLKGFSKNQRASFVERRRAQYTAFGTVTLLFNLIPLVGLFFSFTNTVGAAMWAAQLEEQANIIDGPPSPQSTKTTKQAVEQTDKGKEGAPVNAESAKAK